MNCNVIFMIGPQGSGKGTQAKVLAERLNFYHWDMGAILREERNHAFADGRTVGEIIDSGTLLTDEQLFEVSAARLKLIDSSKGVVFDAIPRRIGQAEWLMQFLAAQGRTSYCTIFLNVPREESVKRLLKRAEIQHREDDTLEAIERRLQQYETATIPVLDYLRQKSDFIEIDGQPSVPEVTSAINAALGLS